MKKSLSLFVFFLLCSTFFGISQAQERRQEEKTIIVSTDVKEEVVPDKFVVELEIKEYYKDGQKKKVPISEIEERFLEAAKEAGILRNAITIQNMGNEFFFNPETKEKDSFVNKSYLMEVRLIENLQKVIMSIGEGFGSIRIVKAVYEAEDLLETEMVKTAIGKARAKAQEILSVIGKVPGEIINIDTSSTSREYNTDDYEKRIDFLRKHSEDRYGLIPIDYIHLPKLKPIVYKVNAKISFEILDTPPDHDRQ